MEQIKAKTIEVAVEYEVDTQWQLKVQNATTMDELAAAIWKITERGPWNREMYSSLVILIGFAGYVKWYGGIRKYP